MKFISKLYFFSCRRHASFTYVYGQAQNGESVCQISTLHYSPIEYGVGKKCTSNLRNLLPLSQHVFKKVYGLIYQDKYVPSYSKRSYFVYVPDSEAEGSFCKQKYDSPIPTLVTAADFDDSVSKYVVYFTTRSGIQLNMLDVKKLKVH